MKTPLFDPKRHYRPLEAKFLEATRRVLSSGRLVLGDETEKFEEEFAKFCGTKYAVMVNSGTSALLATLLAHGIGPEDEVITAPNSFVATAQAIVFSGAKPIFVDIDPKTYNLDPGRLEGAITKKTKAIIPVHLYGQPARMDKINKVAKKYQLLVIEDAAQAHGSSYKDKMAGNLGNTGCFSFFVTKNLPSFGTSGMVTTNNRRIAQKIKILRDNGMVKKGTHILSLNFMPEEIQAAFLRIKLRHLRTWNQKRRKIAKLYRKLLFGLPIILPEEQKNSHHIYHHFVIRTSKRDKLQQFLAVKGIQARPYYPVPIHLQPGFGFLGYKAGDFPKAEKACQEILSLPMFPELRVEEIRYITAQIKRFFRQQPLPFGGS